MLVVNIHFTGDLRAVNKVIKWGGGSTWTVSPLGLGNDKSKHTLKHFVFFSLRSKLKASDEIVCELNSF